MPTGMPSAWRTARAAVRSSASATIVARAPSTTSSPTPSAGCPQGSAFPAGYQRGRELHELQRQLDEVNKELARVKTALKEGVPNPRTRSAEIERLEALTREAAELE